MALCLVRHEPFGPGPDQRERLARRCQRSDAGGFGAAGAAIAKCSPDTALRDIRDLLARGVLGKLEAGSRSTRNEIDDVAQQDDLPGLSASQSEQFTAILDGPTHADEGRERLIGLPRRTALPLVRHPPVLTPCRGADWPSLLRAAASPGGAVAAVRECGLAATLVLALSAARLSSRGHSRDARHRGPHKLARRQP